MCTKEQNVSSRVQQLPASMFCPTKESDLQSSETFTVQRNNEELIKVCVQTVEPLDVDTWNLLVLVVLTNTFIMQINTFLVVSETKSEST